MVKPNWFVKPFFSVKIKFTVLCLCCIPLWTKRKPFLLYLGSFEYKLCLHEITICARGGPLSACLLGLCSHTAKKWAASTVYAVRKGQFGEREREKKERPIFEVPQAEKSQDLNSKFAQNAPRNSGPHTVHNYDLQ